MPHANCARIQSPFENLVLQFHDKCTHYSDIFDDWHVHCTHCAINVFVRLDSLHRSKSLPCLNLRAIIHNNNNNTQHYSIQLFQLALEFYVSHDRWCYAVSIWIDFMSIRYMILASRCDMGKSRQRVRLAYHIRGYNGPYRIFCHSIGFY